MKSKAVAVLLALFLGGIGMHKFYLGKPLWGIIYLVFCWSYIPSIISFVEGIIYLCTSENEFQAKYGKEVQTQNKAFTSDTTLIKHKYNNKKL